MTEEEAKTKSCPQSFAPEVDGEPNPQFPGHMKGQRYGGFQMRCLGSDCMWWRWMPQTQATDGSWNVHETEHWKGYRADAKEGFCGLAGTP